MTIGSYATSSEAQEATDETVQIRAHNRSLRRMGHWTSARLFER